jgi:hypothetical protein
MFTKTSGDLYSAIWQIVFHFIGPPTLFVLLVSILLWSISCYVLKCRLRGSGVILFMFGFFGVTIGLLAGSSNQPTASSLLPALVTAIVGFIGYLTANTIREEFRALVPLCVISMLASTVVGIFFGAFLKS